ncbi:MAG: response regulator transcription factor [Bacteroidetes bacterium]|nr:response regulator transcription factor [Bacteroidota bacterium]
MEKIRTLLVDDHDLVILGVKHLISQYSDIELVGIANDGEEAIAKIKELKPHLVILDIDMPKFSGMEVTEKIIKLFPNIKIILHSSYIDEDHIIKGFEIGALGYVPKTYKPDMLIDAVRCVNSGEPYIKGIVSEIFLSSYNKRRIEPVIEKHPELSAREIEVLKRITEGLSNQEMADKLFISVRTVEVHKANIMKKLKIFNIAELVIYAIRNKIIVL